MRLRSTWAIVLASGSLMAAESSARPLILPTPTPTPAPWEEPTSGETPAPAVSPTPSPAETPAPWESPETEASPAPTPSVAPAPPPSVSAQAPSLAPPAQDPVYLSADLLLGSKQLSTPQYPVPAQGLGGLSLTLAPRGWPVALALDGLASAGQSTPSATGERFEASTATWAAGVRTVFELPSVHPFVGVGGEWVRATTAHVLPNGTSTVRTTDYGSAWGPWAQAGLLVRIGRMFQFGLAARYDTAWVTVAGENLDAGGFQVGAVFGVGMGTAAIPAGVPLL